MIDNILKKIKNLDIEDLNKIKDYIDNLDTISIYQHKFVLNDDDEYDYPTSINIEYTFNEKIMNKNVAFSRYLNISPRANNTEYSFYSKSKTVTVKEKNDAYKHLYEKELEYIKNMEDDLEHLKEKINKEKKAIKKIFKEYLRNNKIDNILKKK